MNVKKCILSVFSLLMLALSGCGGHSEYYENGYERGYGMGSKEVEIIAEAMGVTNLSNIDKSIFDPDKSYSVWMERTIPSDDEYVQSEFKKGFIDGYTQGVNDAIDGGNGTSNNNSSLSDSYSNSDAGSDLSKYTGKWELFQTGLNPDNPTETGLFILKIRSTGDVSIQHSVSSLGYGDTIIASGEGHAELNGEVLYVEITEGKSAGSSFRLMVREGRIYDADGNEFRKSY